MDHFEYNLSDCIDSSSAGMEWVNIKKQFSAHFHQASEQGRKAFLINIASDQACEIFNNMGLSQEETFKFNQILTKLEGVCLPRFLIIYSRYKFMSCKWQTGKKFCDFLQELLYWSNNCEYGEMKDIVLKESILRSISDEKVLKYFLQYTEMDLKEVIDTCSSFDKNRCSKNTQTDSDWVNCEGMDEGMDSLKMELENAGPPYDTTNKPFKDFSEMMDPSNTNSQMQQEKNLENDNETKCTVAINSNKKARSKELLLEVKNNKPEIVEEKNLVCAKCKIEFTDSSLFIVHVCPTGKIGSNLRASQKCSGYKQNFQDVCLKRCKRQLLASNQKYSCVVCNSAFGNYSHLKVHMRLHTCPECPFRCDTCDASFAEALKLKAHKRKHTGERPFECHVCLRTFTWTAAYKRHLRTHTVEKPYRCEVCGNSFADLTSFQHHTHSHTKKKQYKCKLCDSTFLDTSALKLHMRTHTGERPYLCKECGSSFVRSQHLKDHMKLHTGEKPFECKTCGAKFIGASKLKIHQRKHTGEKPYICKICDCRFAWTAAYTRHMRTHTMEKPYSCDTCDACFADHSTLTRHKRTHTKERPYVCKVCHTDFADNSSLHRHTLIHSGEKLYVCEVCGSSFAVKSNMVRHMRTHTGEKPYKCLTCVKKFTDSWKLNRHTKIHNSLKLKRPNKINTKKLPKRSFKQQNIDKKKHEDVDEKHQPQYQELQPLRLHEQQPQKALPVQSHLMVTQHTTVDMDGSHKQSSFDGTQHQHIQQSNLIPLPNRTPYNLSML